MSLTQHQLVKQLGISRGTLHRILYNSPLVKASTRERVLNELQKMNYTPNIIAQGLKTRRTKTIGIIGPAALKVSNFAKVSTLHLAARQHGYSVIIEYSDGSVEGDAACIRDLRSRMVDGFVALNRGLEESIPLYQSIIDSGTPLVTLYPVGKFKTDCVYVDTRQAFRRLTEHLAGLGHRKIGLLLESSVSRYTANREAGFREAMQQAGLPVNEEWIVRVAPDGMPTSKGLENVSGSFNGISDYQMGFWGASLLLARRERPTALVCQSDEFAIGVLRACDLAKVAVPEELSVTGYDDNESAKFARVPLTTVHQPNEKLGEEAIALLVKRIEQPDKKDRPVSRSLGTSLIIRESCGAPS
jgi:DNA-binding LacI/PurR family transcriptional regulator